MHDDDDPKENSGRIYRAGFQPSAGRAPYALEEGQPALQEEPDPNRNSDNPRGMDRRQVLGLGLLAGAGVASLGYAAIRTPSLPPSRSRPTPLGTGALDQEALRLVQHARLVAAGDFAELRRDYGVYLTVLENFAPRDDLLWEGVERLARHALAVRDRHATDLAEHLHRVMQRVTPPRALRGLTLELGDYVRRRRGK